MSHVGPGGWADPAGDPGDSYDDYQFQRRRPRLAPADEEVARRRQIAVAAVAVLAVLALASAGYSLLGGDDDGGAVTDFGVGDGGAAAAGPDGTTTTTKETGGSGGGAGRDLTQVPARATDQFVNPASSGRMWSSEVPGILTFRGNPTRTYYGRGDVPKAPKVRWFYPRTGGMCASSSAVDGRAGPAWVVFGANDKALHLRDATPGPDILPPLPTGDIIKGSVTVDPDGFPLVYTGSRDNYYRVIAIDRGGAAQELWKLSATAVSPTLWNNDWDGAGLVLDDFLFEGGENSQFHAVKLNRAYGADGKVTVAPELVFNAPGWDQQEIDDLAGNRAKEMSIENSVAMSGDTVYFANSGGLVSGWDMAPLRTGGTPTRTFRFWTGDDTDASVVIDAEGYLYVAVEYERGNKRAAEVGQLMKLDPRKPDAPLVWKYDDRGANPAGFWTTPALHDGVVIAPTNGGEVVGLDQRTGAELWSFRLPGPTWQSSVVVDDVLIQGDCSGVLHGYDVSDPRVRPPELWSVPIGGCIESTPSVWKGRIYVGTRAGRFFSLGDDGELESPTASRSGGGGGD